MITVSVDDSKDKNTVLCSFYLPKRIVLAEKRLIWLCNRPWKHRGV